MSGPTAAPHSTAASQPGFTPPSPGAWELDQTHFTKPPSIYMADAMPEPMMRGFAAATRTYGVLLDHLEVAVINRFIYTAPRPVGAPKSAKGPPPRLVFEIVRRLHPEIRRRNKRAEEVFRTRFWREDVAYWDRDVRPAMRARADALFAEDLASATDAQLAEHIRQATDFLKTAAFNHHRFNVCAMLPVGDFLVQAMAWTGLPAGDLLQTMRGLSPVSAGAVDELVRLRTAILADRAAQDLLDSGRPDAAILADLQARPDPVGAAARAYVGVVGTRVLGGYDVADRHANEHPELLVKIVRSALADDSGRRAAAEQKLAGLRERVPADRRAAFDDLLKEAQFVYRIRDERVFHGDALAVGVARRAILAAGARLAERGRIEHADDLVDATAEEIVALIERRGGPSAAEIAARAKWRRETPISSAPANLGFAPSPPPPPEWLPPASARMQRVVTLVLSLMFDVHQSAEPSPSSRRFKGFGVSPGAYEGPVRLIRDVEELPLVQPGEVLVTRSTGPTFNVVMPLIGALVTERGGVLSHAAIVSREYGLPGIVGCAGVTAALKTGMRVRVDGEKGEVWTVS